MGPPSGASSKIKVLCLHGFTQNAEVFRRRTGSIRKPLKSKVDFVFVDGPHSAAGAFPDAERRALGTDDDDGADGVGPRAWWLVGENAAASVAAAASAPPSTADESPAGQGGAAPPATTWVRPALSRQMRGWEETAEVIREVAASRGPFDGILAFSQGASTSALALALIPQLAETVTFAVLVGGFEPMDPDMAQRLSVGQEGGLSSRMKIRSLHVHGANDAMVSRQRVERLMCAFEDPELFEHEGGHGVPTGGDFRARLKEFILSGE